MTRANFSRITTKKLHSAEIKQEEKNQQLTLTPLTPLS